MKRQTKRVLKAHFHILIPRPHGVLATMTHHFWSPHHTWGCLLLFRDDKVNISILHAQPYSQICSLRVIRHCHANTIFSHESFMAYSNLIYITATFYYRDWWHTRRFPIATPSVKCSFLASSLAFVELLYERVAGKTRFGPSLQTWVRLSEINESETWAESQFSFLPTSSSSTLEVRMTTAP